MDTVTLRAAPSAMPLVLNQVRNLVIRLRWELLACILFIAAYQFTAPISSDFLDYTALIPFVNGAVAFPASLVFTFLAVYWALSVWSDQPSGQRPVFSAYPVSRQRHNAIRITAGAIILLIFFPLAWAIGAFICEIAAPGRSILSLDAYNGWSFFITFIGFLNAYFFGSILAILLRRPEPWFVLLFFLMIFLSVLMIIGQLGYAGYGVLWKLFNLLTGEPVGISYGWGIFVFRIESEVWIPGLDVVLLWTVLLVAGIYASSKLHRDN